MLVMFLDFFTGKVINQIRVWNNFFCFSQNSLPDWFRTFPRSRRMFSFLSYGPHEHVFTFSRFMIFLFSDFLENFCSTISIWPFYRFTKNEGSWLMKPSASLGLVKIEAIPADNEKMIMQPTTNFFFLIL